MLLGEDETQQIIEEFDQLQRAWDCRIQLDDWLKKKRRDYEELHDVPMDEDAVKQMAVEFGSFVDEGDDSNTITWMDYLGMESLKWLHKQPKSHLVGLLYPREVRRMKIIFARHDLSGSAETAIGIVDASGADRVLEEWLRELGMTESEESDGRGGKDQDGGARQSSSKNGVSDGLAVGGSGGGSYGSNLQTWQAFLLDKALCVIAARPNRVMGGKNYIKFAVQLERKGRE